MEETSNSRKEYATELAGLLSEYRAQDVVAIDVADVSDVTDLLIICTVNSGGHLRGLYRRVVDYLSEHKIETLRSAKRPDENRWVLIDCGFMVIHLMDAESREFYELEKLWFSGETIYSD
jgi:ribosome-associated protein